MVGTSRAACGATPRLDPPGSRAYDGVVCLGGEDWWYHNRGHFDFQLMRRCSRRMPVLYVNSLGARIPSPLRSSSFARRILRKLKSVTRGLVVVEKDFAVLSVVTVPGLNGSRFLSELQAGSISSAASRLGMAAPLLWLALPTAIDLARKLGGAGLVYQRTDRYEAEEDIDARKLIDLDRRAKTAADLTLFSSRVMFEEERGGCRKALYLDHGVDYELFAAAGDAPRDPDDMRGIARPRVGYVGAMDPITIDQDLVAALVRSMPDISFVFVGPSTLGGKWREAGNAHFLGQKDYGLVPSYMAACDALIMPWRDNEWIRACNPVKLKEYLCTARPVVSTYFPELESYKGLVRIASSPEEFSSAIRAALRDPPPTALCRARVANETWEARLETVVASLAEAGLSPTGGAGAEAARRGAPIRRGPARREEGSDG